MHGGLLLEVASVPQDAYEEVLDGEVLVDRCRGENAWETDAVADLCSR